MKVTFADFGQNLASSRLRGSIPQRELEKLGIPKGNDVLIYGKHWIPLEQTKPYKKRIFDVCDDHFHDPFRDYYLKHVEAADAVTCNSEAMREIILQETGIQAHVIQEPYESEEREPSIGDVLFWFGHDSNLRDLYKIADRLEHSLIVMSGKSGIPWSAENLKKIMQEDLIVIIPTGKSMAKSENRMVESIRNGKYVCAEYLPAYEPFYQFYPCLDIPSHIKAALGSPKESVERIKQAQDYIRDRYSPETVAKQWVKVIHEYC